MSPQIRPKTAHVLRIIFRKRTRGNCSCVWRNGEGGEWGKEKTNALFHSSNITAVGITCHPQISHLPTRINLISHIGKDGVTFSSLCISTVWHLHFYSYLTRSQWHVRLLGSAGTHFPPPHFYFFLQIIQSGAESRPGSAWPRLPHLIQRCPGSKSTLSCPWVHFHCLETRPASSSSGECQLCLRGRGAACINWLFLQVRDKEQQRGTNYHSLYVQNLGKGLLVTIVSTLSQSDSLGAIRNEQDGGP